jgi:hypothetical protein
MVMMVVMVVVGVSMMKLRKVKYELKSNLNGG